MGTIQVSDRTQWVVIQLHSEDGQIGIGEASDAGPTSLVRRVAKEAASLLAGHSPSVLDSRQDPLTPWCDHSSPHLRHARRTIAGALRQAAVDLRARIANVPVWHFLGGTHPGPLPLYANINRACVTRTSSEMASLATKARDSGFWGVKCAPFDDANDLPNPLYYGLHRLEAIRARVGPDYPLMVDLHNKLSLTNLLKVLPVFQQLDLYWIEDAVSLSEVDRMCHLANLTPIALAGGETGYDPDQVLAAAEYKGLDYFLVDVKHAGGLKRSIALSELAASHGSQISPHNPSGPVGTLASANISTIVPNFHSLEFCVGQETARSSLTQPTEQVRGGYLVLPDGPGFAVELSSQLLMREL